MRGLFVNTAITLALGAILVGCGSGEEATTPGSGSLPSIVTAGLGGELDTDRPQGDLAEAAPTREPEQDLEPRTSTQAAPTSSRAARRAAASSDRQPRRDAGEARRAGLTDQRSTPATQRQPAPRHPTASPVLVATDGIAISRMVMARGVEERQPIDPGASFELEGARPIYAFLEVSNPERIEQELSVTWLRLDDDEETTISRVSVEVGAHRRWRTWAYTGQLRQPGRYAAEIRDGEGQLLARHPFEVTR